MTANKTYKFKAQLGWFYVRQPEITALRSNSVPCQPPHCASALTYQGTRFGEPALGFHQPFKQNLETVTELHRKSLLSSWAFKWIE